MGKSSSAVPSRKKGVAPSKRPYVWPPIVLHSVGSEWVWYWKMGQFDSPADGNGGLMIADWIEYVPEPGGRTEIK